MTKMKTGEHAEGDDRQELLALHSKEEAEYFDCLALCCDCLYGEYWFRLSLYVYDGNRSFAPILRQSRWCLLEIAVGGDVVVDEDVRR
jgi:hypothetical protein